MDKWSLEHETKQSPVVLLCYAYLCMWLHGDFPVSIPFPFLQSQYWWLHASENFNVSEWRRPNGSADQHSVTFFSFNPKQKCSLRKGFVLFGFVFKRYLAGLILAAGQGCRWSRPLWSFPICSTACANAFIFEPGSTSLFCPGTCEHNGCWSVVITPQFHNNRESSYS